MKSWNGACCPMYRHFCLPDTSGAIWMPIHRFYGSDTVFVLITYDVNTQDAAGRKRLRRVAKQCVNYGVRVQNSVFECVAEPAKILELKDKLMKEIDPKKDSLRFYYLGSQSKTKVEHLGAKDTINVEEPLIF